VKIGKLWEIWMNKLSLTISTMALLQCRERKTCWKYLWAAFYVFSITIINRYLDSINIFSWGTCLRTSYSSLNSRLKVSAVDVVRQDCGVRKQVNQACRRRCLRSCDINKQEVDKFTRNALSKRAALCRASELLLVLCGMRLLTRLIRELHP
jgi:hypothetical protein